MPDVINVLIVDDESSARSNLRLLMENYCEGVQVVGEAANAVQALELITTLKPEALFLDIQMPGMSGLELAEQLAESNMRIVFCTAYEHYAIRAFKASAVDYLLKPVKIAELQQTVSRLGQAIALHQHAGHLNVLAENLQQEGPRKIALPWKGGFKVIDSEAVMRIKSDNSYSTVHLKDGSELVVTKSIGEFEEILNDFPFLRIHNSHLVNLDFLDAFSSKDGGLVVLKDGSELPIARRRLKEFKEISAVFLGSI